MVPSWKMKGIPYKFIILIHQSLLIHQSTVTLQGTNISHLGKFGKSSSKVPLLGGHVSSQRVTFNYKEPFVRNNNQEFMVHHGDFRNSTAVVVASHLNFKGCQILR